AVLNVVGREPTLERTCTPHGPAVTPGSVKEPSEKLFGVPSTPIPLPGDTEGATFATVTWNVFESIPPSLSVTLTVTVYVCGPSAYVWLCAARAPCELALKVVCVEPSPQLTSTAHGLSRRPGSAMEPSVEFWALPSKPLWSLAAVTVGATFATVTVKDFVSVPPSLSVTFTLTVYVLGPSA